MKKMTLKRLLTLVTVLAVLLSAMSFSAYAAEPETEPEQEDTISEAGTGLYVSGFQWGAGTSRISYNTGGSNLMIKVTGPPGFTTYYVTKNGTGSSGDFFEITTPPGSYEVKFVTNSSIGNTWSVTY